MQKYSQAWLDSHLSLPIITFASLNHSSSHKILQLSAYMLVPPLCQGSWHFILLHTNIWTQAFSIFWMNKALIPNVRSFLSWLEMQLALIAPFLFLNYFIVIQLQLSAVTPHLSPQPQPTPSPSLASTLPFVLSMCPLELFLKTFPHSPISPPTAPRVTVKWFLISVSLGIFCLPVCFVD